MNLTTSTCSETSTWTIAKSGGVTKIMCDAVLVLTFQKNLASIQHPTSCATAWGCDGDEPFYMLFLSNDTASLQYKAGMVVDSAPL